MDLEYNRWHVADLNMVRTKVLELKPGSHRKRVYPDVIVNDRSGSTPGCNLLVLEANHQLRRAKRLFDYRKLATFQTHFGYQFVFLEFPRRGEMPRWHWLSPNLHYAKDLPQPIM